MKKARKVASILCVATVFAAILLYVGFTMRLGDMSTEDLQRFAMLRFILLGGK